MRTSTKIILIVLSFFSVVSCNTDEFTPTEIKRINNDTSGKIMPIFTINEKSDSLLLRQEARTIKAENLESETHQRLMHRMLATVQDTANLGVGIAAPQVGISVQMIYVQRFDKAGEPFEVYYNPVIEEYGDSIKAGREGCLSIPHYRGLVERPQSIVISYMDSLGKPQSEKINGFTAVIFQHEVDHLNGELYYDRVENGFDGLTYIDEL